MSYARILLLILLPFTLFSNTSKAIKFIKSSLPIAIKATQGTPVKVSVMIAQACEESGYGTSETCRTTNNHFGIKNRNKQGDYTQYSSKEESFKGYVERLKDPIYQRVLKSKYVEDYVEMLRVCGYCPDPLYPTRIISLVRRYDLERFDSLPAQYDFINELKKITFNF